jgi:hypothetical protein
MVESIESLLSLEEKNAIFSAKKSIENLGLNVSDNVMLLCHALENTKHTNGIYLECGVFKGSTLLTTNEFCKIRNIHKKFLGVDSFSGFPPKQTTNMNDLPKAFDDLLLSNKISKEHHQLAKERLLKIENDSHLNSGYFSDPGQIVFEQARLRNIELIKGSFEEVLPNLQLPISVFHIDCDLYEPYLECLTYQFKNVVKGGYIVLDEYYSLKYPGARIAVDEFLKHLDKSQYSLKMLKTNDFERWYIEKK